MVRRNFSSSKWYRRQSSSILWFLVIFIGPTRMNTFRSVSTGSGENWSWLVYAFHFCIRFCSSLVCSSILAALLACFSSPTHINGLFFYLSMEQLFFYPSFLCSVACWCFDHFISMYLAGSMISCIALLMRLDLLFCSSLFCSLRFACFLSS